MPEYPDILGRVLRPNNFLIELSRKGVAVHSGAA